MHTLASMLHSVVLWVEANPGWSAFIVGALLTMIANSLGKYPKAAGVVGSIRKFIDLLQPFTHSSSPGTWKPPLVTIRDGKLALSLSQPPTDPGAIEQPAVKVGLGVVLPLAFLVALSACASSPYDKARQTLTGIELGRSGAEKALAAYDGPHQLELAAAARARCKSDLPAPEFKACTEKEGRPALDAWRADFDTAVKVFTGLGASVAVATVGIHALEISHAPSASVDKILQALLPALGDVLAAMKKLGIAPGALAFLAGGV